MLARFTLCSCLAPRIFRVSQVELQFLSRRAHRDSVHHQRAAAGYQALRHCSFDKNKQHGEQGAVHLLPGVIIVLSIAVTSMITISTMIATSITVTSFVRRLKRTVQGISTSLKEPVYFNVIDPKHMRQE